MSNEYKVSQNPNLSSLTAVAQTAHSTHEKYTMGNVYGPTEADLPKMDGWICAPNVMSL